MTNRTDYVELGLAYPDVCEDSGRGMNGKKLDHLSRFLGKAIKQLTAWDEPSWMVLAVTIEDWQGFETRSPRRVNEIYPPGSSTHLDGHGPLDNMV